MSVPNTKEIMNAFFSEPANEKFLRFRKLVERKELYEYEKEIGKSIFTMNAEELLQMFQTFKPYSKSGSNKSAIQKMYTRLKRVFAKIFDYCIQNYDIVPGRINLFRSDEMKLENNEQKLMSGGLTLSFEYLQEVIDRIHEEYNEDRADYYECAYLMFYCGFKSTTEFCEFTEKDIDFENKTVKVNERTIRLTDRCMELLIKVHNMDEYFEDNVSDKVMLSWRDSYYKFPVRKYSVDSYDSRTSYVVGKTISVALTQYVTNPLQPEIKFGSNDIHFLGFYDFIVRKIGEEHAEEIIKSQNDSDSIKELIQLAEEYDIGYHRNNSFYLRKCLKQFVEWDGTEEEIEDERILEIE